MNDLDCQQVFALLSEYIDGELPEDVCASLAAHIEKCPACIEFVESLRKARDLCRGFQGAEQPGQLDREARERMLRTLRDQLEL